MGIAYSEFKTTGANLLADIRTAILASTDWSRPNAGARPDTYKATTTRGADMVVDLNASALTSNRLNLNFYTSYDGTTLGTIIPSTRYMHFKEAATGTLATNVFYVIVSASKEHLFISIEGPRAGETAADSALYGSIRQYMFMSDLVPYFDSGVDPTPTVAAYATYQTTYGPGVPHNFKVALSKSKSGSLFWMPGSMLTLEWPSTSQGAQVTQNRLGLDGNLFLAPYVVADDAEGVRGRLARFFYAGASYGPNDAVAAPAQHGDFVTYDSIKYKILNVGRSSGSGNSQQWGAFGAANNNGSGLTMLYGPLVAVPYAAA
jgi:hypothetical protein